MAKVGHFLGPRLPHKGGIQWLAAHVVGRVPIRLVEEFGRADVAVGLLRDDVQLGVQLLGIVHGGLHFADVEDAHLPHLALVLFLLLRYSLAYRTTQCLGVYLRLPRAASDEMHMTVSLIHWQLGVLALDVQLFVDALGIREEPGRLLHQPDALAVGGLHTEPAVVARRNHRSGGGRQPDDLSLCPR